MRKNDEFINYYFKGLLSEKEKILFFSHFYNDNTFRSKVILKALIIKKLNSLKSK
jgi:hypothetical protein